MSEYDKVKQEAKQAAVKAEREALADVNKATSFVARHAVGLASLLSLLIGLGVGYLIFHH